MESRIFVIILALLLLIVPTSPAHAAGVISVCDEAHLLAALTGGNVTFNCIGTILLTNTITVVVVTALDGSGQNVTISGNDMVGAFRL